MNKWIQRSLQVSAVAGGIILAGATASQAATNVDEAENYGIGNGNQVAVDEIAIPVNVSGNALSVAGIGDAAGLGSGDGAAVVKGAHSSHGSSNDVTNVSDADNIGIGNGNQVGIGEILVPVNVSGNAGALSVIGDALAEGSGDGAAIAG